MDGWPAHRIEHLQHSRNTTALLGAYHSPLSLIIAQASWRKTGFVTEFSVRAFLTATILLRNPMTRAAYTVPVASGCRQKTRYLSVFDVPQPPYPSSSICCKRIVSTSIGRVRSEVLTRHQGQWVRKVRSGRSNRSDPRVRKGQRELPVLACRLRARRCLTIGIMSSKAGCNMPLKECALTVWQPKWSVVLNQRYDSGRAHVDSMSPMPLC